MADQHIIDAVLALPAEHRTHLFSFFDVDVPRTAQRRRKAELLAEAIEAAGDYSYFRLYVGQGGGPLNWTKLPPGTIDLDAIEQRFRDRDPRFLNVAGARPHMDQNGPPVIHRVLRPKDGLLVIELSALDAQRHYQQNWETQDIFVDHLYRVAVSQDPAAIEFRSAAGKVKKLAEICGEFIGADLKAGTECRLNTLTLEQDLKTSLNARSSRGFAEHNHGVVSRSSYEGNPDVDFQTSAEHGTWLKQFGARETAHVYICHAEWDDGYDEDIRYKVDRDTGVLSVNGGLSELALEHLRKHVVALF